jgi:AcrR family transcriptional regulator
MRRLARALNRDPMILYRHAPNKAALLDGVVEVVLAQLNVDPADPDWAAELRAVARDYRQLALAHPHVVPLLVIRPLATPLALRPPGTLRPLEDVLALHIYRALFGFLHGHVLNELQELVDNPDETDDLLRLGLHRLPIGEFPLLRSLAPVLAAYDGAAELERGPGNHSREPPVHAPVQGRVPSGHGSIIFDHEGAPCINSRHHRHCRGPLARRPLQRAPDLTASAGGTRSAAGPGRTSSRRSTRRRRARKLMPG